MNKTADKMLAEATHVSYKQAVDAGKKKVYEKIDKTTIRSLNLVNCANILAFLSMRNVFMAIVNLVIIIVSTIVKDKYLSQIMVVVFSPMRVVQKLVFCVGLSFDHFIIADIKQDEMIYMVLKACKYITMGIFLIGTV